MKLFLQIFFIFTLLFSQYCQATIIFINEIHYDNSGSDDNEFIEVFGEANLDLNGWSIALYNGSNGTVYQTLTLSGKILNESNGFGAVSFDFSGIQNGSPDGVALIDNEGELRQFLSYEGSFTATEGAALGEKSIDIGIHEPTNTPKGLSLQLKGNGREFNDFTWDLAKHSKGLINATQVAAPLTKISAPNITLLLLIALLFLMYRQPKLLEQNIHIRLVNQ